MLVAFISFFFFLLLYVTYRSLVYSWYRCSCCDQKLRLQLKHQYCCIQFNESEKSIDQKNEPRRWWSPEFGSVELWSKWDPRSDEGFHPRCPLLRCSRSKPKDDNVVMKWNFRWEANKRLIIFNTKQMLQRARDGGNGKHAYARNFKSKHRLQIKDGEGN